MSEEQKEVDFSELSFEERIEAVNKRLDNQPGRISDPRELLDLKGETMYLVTSPFGKDQDIGNCFILTWDIGTVTDHRGNLVERDRALAFDDDEKYLCGSHSNSDHFLSLKDFNIVPNSYNNHSAFRTKAEADAYAMYRKMCFAEDPSIAELEGDYAHWFTQEDVDRLLKSEKEANS